MPGDDFSDRANALARQGLISPKAMQRLMGNVSPLEGGNVSPSQAPAGGWQPQNMGELRESLGRDVKNLGNVGTPMDWAMAMAGGPKLRAGALRAGISATEPGYVYHATNLDRAQEIAQGGLKTHKPWEFTDQGEWPDGSTERRNYFTPTAEHTWQFAPEEGQGVLLRIKHGNDIKREATGDLYSRKTIDPSRIEMMHEDGSFHPIGDFFKE